MKIIFFILVSAIFSATVYGQNVDSKSNKKLNKSKIKKEFIKPPEVFPANGYSHAISVSGGKTIYVSGQVALNQKGEIVGKNDVKAQTQQVFENIKSVLAASGATFADVVKFTYYVKNLKPEILPAIRQIRDSFLPNDQPPPTSSLIGVEMLFREDILIEIECIAVINK